MTVLTDLDLSFGITPNKAATVLLLDNPLAAASGNQRYSPAIQWSGNGWSTGSASSKSVNFRAYVVPVQGSTASGYLLFESSIASGAFGQGLALFSSGGLSLGSTTDPGSGWINASTGFQVGGSQIAAANLADGTTGTGAIVLATSPSLTNPTVRTVITMSSTLDVVKINSDDSEIQISGGPDLGVTFKANASGGKGQVRFSQNSTVPSSSNATLDDVVVTSQTTIVTGNTAITTAQGFNKFSIYKPTFIDDAACTISRGASLYIEDAPGTAGSLVLTNPYALWVDNGISRFDGGIKFTEPSPASGLFVISNGSAYSDSGYTLPTTAGNAGQVFYSDGSNIGTKYLGGQTSVTSDVDQTSTSETIHVSFSVPGNSVSAGTVFRIWAYGDMDQGTSGIQFTPRIRWGGVAGTLVLTGPTLNGPTGSAGTLKVWKAEVYLTIRSVGASGSAHAVFGLEHHMGSGYAYGADVTANAGSPVTIDTTTTKVLALTWLLSSASGSPHVRTRGGGVEVVKP